MRDKHKLLVCRFTTFFLNMVNNNIICFCFFILHLHIITMEIEEINCGSPGILPNGWLEGTRTTLHAVVTFRCQEGMTFEGPSYRTICQADGRWSHPLPRCYGKKIFRFLPH